MCAKKKQVAIASISIYCVTRRHLHLVELKPHGTHFEEQFWRTVKSEDTNLGILFPVRLKVKESKSDEKKEQRTPNTTALTLLLFDLW